MVVVAREAVGIAAVAGGQAQDQVEGMQAVGVGVCLVGCVGKGMAEKVELGLGEKKYRVDENLVDDLEQSTFCNVPKNRCYAT
jgi:hypothetical protein